MEKFLRTNLLAISGLAFGICGICGLKAIFDKENIIYSDYAIVITGCDSGFGEGSARDLAKLGFHVLATCMTDEGIERLKDIVGLVMKVDVTDDKDVSNFMGAAEKYMSNQKIRLWAVVNNAGVAPFGYMDWLPMDRFRFAMEVNYFGLIRVSKAFLPFLKKTRRSRIVNLSSMAGFSAGHCFGAYSGSKHAVEGFARAIRPELRPWGVHVCNINPTFMRTPLVTGNEDLTLAEYNKISPELKSQYPVRLLTEQTTLVHLIMEDPIKVVNRIRHVITCRNPTLNHYVGNLAVFLRFQEILLSLMPGRFDSPKDIIAAYQQHD